jgi:hypothetical protein
VAEGKNVFYSFCLQHSCPLPFFGKIKIVGGSDLCRIAFWQWVFTRIEVKRCRLDNEIGAALGSQLDAEKAAGRGVRLVRSRISAKAAKLLFRELVKVLE